MVTVMGLQDPSSFRE